MGVLQTYHPSVAAEAAKIPAKTARRWLDNKVIALRGNDSNPTGSGNHCGWSRNRIAQLAVTQALVEKNVSPSAGAKAALVFSDFGNAGRKPGECFGVCKTVLFISDDGPMVRNIDFNFPIFDSSNEAVIVCVDLNRIVDHVDSVLAKY